MAQRFGILAVVCAVVVGAPSAARADPITVTSGGAHLPWDDASSFSAFGDGLALQSLFLRAPISPQLVCFTGCLPGTVVDMRGVLGGSGAGSLGVALIATIDGVSHTEFGRPETLLDLTGVFLFDAPPVVLPPFAGAERHVVFVTAPFSFQGNVTGFRRDAPEVPRFHIDLDGRGTATLSLSVEPGVDRYIRPEVTYAFSPVDPIPEPAALLLVGSGLAGVLMRRNGRFARRHSRRSPHSSAGTSSGNPGNA